MDTNRNTANNYQINTFVKGMNSDTSYDMIGADQYLFGLNIRITNNTLLFGDQHLNFTEGVVTPVYLGNINYCDILVGGDRIVAAQSIGNIGAIITRDDDYYYIYKASLDDNRLNLQQYFVYSYSEEEKGTIHIYDGGRDIVEYDETKDLRLDTFSIVLHKETDNVLNLYVADGIHPVVQINLNDEYTAVPSDIDYLISGRLLPTDRLMLEKTSGRLKTQQVQYTYRFYKKHGTTTKLAPLTNKFNIIDPNRNKELGNAADTRTSVGLKITLTPSNDWTDYYDYLLIYRISYIKPNESPHVYLIHDELITDTIEIIDKGDDELQELSIDEFYALNSQIIIPQSIESNQGYLFAGNIKDETTFTINSTLDNSIQCVKGDVMIDGDNAITGDLTRTIVGTTTISDYFEQCGVLNATNEDSTYNSIFGSSLLRSLRRDEIYKYGVVYYDKYGARSNVIEIGEVLTSPCTEDGWKLTSTSVDAQTGNKTVYAKPIGIKCTIDTNITGREIKGYQIVRCEKTDNYTKNLFQVALSRPSRQSRYEQENGDLKTNPTYRTPYYPNVYLSTLFLYISYLTEQLIENGIHDVWTSYFDYAGTNVENLSTYQAFAPEINIARKDTLSTLSSYSIELQPLKFVYLNESLSDIAGLFESIPNRLDTGDVLVYLETDTPQHKQDVTNLLNAAAYSVTTTNGVLYADVVLTSLQSSLQNTDLRIYIFVPSGYKLTHANFYTIGSTQEYNDLDVLEYDTILYNFGHNPDNKLYTYYQVSGEFSTGEGLRIYLEEIQQVVGSHLKDITGTSSLYNSLENDANLDMHRINNGAGKAFLSTRSRLQQKKEDKAEHSVVLKLYASKYFVDENPSTVIENVADVKNPDWSQGFSSIQLGGDDVRVQSAIKQYKSFTSNVGGKQFVNWVANGMYNLAATQREASTQLGNEDGDFVFHIENEAWDDREKGWIGPGPVSILVNTQSPDSDSKLRTQVQNSSNDSLFGTLLANIQHTALQYNDKYTQYYGFGNFRPVQNTDPESPNYGTEEVIIFDGDIYITPAEFTNMFKTYDFNDLKATLMSGQVVYYIPMESRINTFFDYGMNYRNTSSSNLMLEPGEITGIASQARPLHLYNMIYSDNNTSIEVFSPQIPEDEDSLNHIPHRICYSQLKTDGESIDNWLIFKPIDFIDVDSKYGEITHLLTSDNTLYYWLNKAFGKLSVNERSLVKDENSNSIQLGTGGVLNRYDYLSTRYGMRKDDRAAISAEHGIYWIDVNNKAIPAFTGNGVVNYSEICNVLNLVNQHIDESYVPTIYYDLLNYELLCGIKQSWQQIFNLKLNCATSVYTRDYEQCIDINNLLFGLRCVEEDEETMTLGYNKLNYLKSGNEENKTLLSPTIIKFAVNTRSSLTKVYDNQKIVLMGNVDETGRKNYPHIGSIYYPFLTNKTWEFKTDYQQSNSKPLAYRDTENNVWYAIPRNNYYSEPKPYGERLRGKWLTTQITITNPEKFAISHIITKFRQSYS